MASLKEIQKLAITMHLADEDVKDIVTVTKKSERTIYRYIEQFNNGELDIDLSDVKRTVSEFKKDESLDILGILKSNSYSGKVKEALGLIDKKTMQEEIANRGIGNITRFIGTLIDKRLKSYTHELEKENLELKKKMADNGRQIVFVNEDEVYASGVKLPNEHIKNIS
jgi:hypothetical protein